MCSSRIPLLYKPHVWAGSLPSTRWPTQNDLSGIFEGVLFPSDLSGHFLKCTLQVICLYIVVFLRISKSDCFYRISRCGYGGVSIYICLSPFLLVLSYSEFFFVCFCGIFVLLLCMCVMREKEKVWIEAERIWENLREEKQ